MTMAMKLKLSKTEAASEVAKKAVKVERPSSANGKIELTSGANGKVQRPRAGNAKLESSSTGNVKVKPTEAPKKLMGNQYRLFVGHLSLSSNEKSVKAHFEKYGEITDVYFPPGKEGSGLHRGYCFVTFSKFYDKHPLDKKNHKIDGR